MLKKIFLSTFLLLFSVVALAQQNPAVLLQQVSSQMLTQLVKQKAVIKANPQVLDNIVSKILLPHIDLNVMSRSVVGRNYWQKASKTDRAQFNREFTKFVTRTYSTAFENYTNERVLFYPIRGGFANKKRVQVYSKIKRQSGPNIPMTYRLYRAGNTWKVYDFSVEGVSMVQSYRSQFASVLSQKGLRGLVVDLASHNRKTQ